MNGRKIISVVLMLALVITMAVPATVCAASGLTDVNGHWAEAYINKAINKGFVKGYADGTFKPDNPVTRAEFSTMINKAIGNTATAGISFMDVPNAEWYYNDVAKGVAATYVSGYDDNSFRPNSPITRQEAACMLSRIVPVYGSSTNIKSYPDSAKVELWASDSLQRICGKGYIGAYSDGNLHPTDSLTRAQTAKIICDVLEKESVVTAATNVKSSTTLKGKIYANGVTLTKDLDDEDAEISGCVILGTLSIQGGGENTVTVENTRVANASVSKSDEAVRVLLKGETCIGTMSAAKTATIETSSLDTGTFGGGIKKLDIESSAKTTLKGIFQKVNVKGSEADMTLASGSIKELNVPSGGKKSDVTVDDNATVETATVDAESYFHGDGTIKKMKANANSITYEKAPKDVTVGSGVKTRPTVGNKRSDIEFSPEDDATGVSENVKPTITFDEAIETYKGKDIDSDYLEDNIVFKKKNSSGSDIDFTAKINSSDKVITITPEDDLSEDQAYYLAFASKIFRTKSDEENISAHSVNWTVGDKDDDGVSFSPENGDTGVKVTENPTITFDSAIETYKGKEIDDDYLEDNIIFRESKSSGTKVKFTAEINSKNKVITIKPKSDLDKDQKYYLGFETKIFRTESKEKNIPAKSVTFTAGDADSDVSFRPSNNSTNVATTADVTITFDEKMYNSSGGKISSSYMKDYITFKDNSSNSNVSFSPSISSSYRVITLDPSSSLVAGHKYTVTISSKKFKNSSGTYITSKSTTFTVASANVDVSAIDNAITNANNALKNVEVSANGSDVYTDTSWVLSGVKTALTSAITTATNAKSSAKTSAAVTNAANALITATNTFNNEKKPGTKVRVDVSGIDSAINAAENAKSRVEIGTSEESVPAGNAWVTQNDMNELLAAIETAKAAKTSVNTAAEATSAENSLRRATEIFNNNISYGTKKDLDKATLADKLNDAKNLKETVKISSNSGTDILTTEYWVTPNIMSDFQSAINAAEAVLGSAKTQDELENAVSALGNAMSVFSKEKDMGSCVPANE